MKTGFRESPEAVKRRTGQTASADEQGKDEGGES